MATINLLPPSPLGSPPGSGFWNDWYEKLRVLINTIASGFSWSLITGTPTTLAGYGITDAQTKLNNSAGLAAALSDETGTGLSVFNTTPTLVTPILGAATGTSVALTALSNINGNSASLPTAQTGTLLELGNADGTNTRLNLDGFGSGSAIVSGRRANNTNASPTAVANNDVLIQFQGFGYGSTGYSSTSRATIKAVASQTWTDSNQGTRIEFLTTPNGSTTLATGLLLDQSGQLALQISGTGLSIKEGSNPKQGKSAMTTGAVTVSTTAVTASSRIFISINDAGSGALTNIGSIYVDNIIAGTSFDIRSTNALDTSSVVWLITEPS